MNSTPNPVHSFNNSSLNNSNITTNSPSNSTNSNHNTLKSKHKNLITLSTLNIRGFNDKTKLTSLLNNITNDRTIICCSETKNTQHSPLPTKMNNKTIISSLPNSSASNGASIILTKSITNHIFKTFSLNEFWCAIHLKFKPKVDIIIISCYLPHDPTPRKKAVKSLRDFIRQHTNKHIIIAGDFNSFPNSAPSINAPSPSFKKQIYKYLHNFTDIAKATNKELNFTHFTNTSASRLDQIWITNDLASKILSYKVSDQFAIQTDHKQVTAILDWFEYKPERISFSTKTYQFHKATKEQILSMQETIKLTITTTPNLSWEALNITVKNALDANIPKRDQTNPTRPNRILQKYTLALKSIKKAIHNIKNNKTHQKLSPLATETLHSISINPPSLKSLRKAQKILLKEKLIKTREIIINEIQANIEKNYLRFWAKPKASLKKALGDLKPSLDLSILADNDQLY